MTDALDPRDLMNLSPEMLDQVERETNTFILTVPSSAERDAKGVARWTETVVVESAQRSDIIGRDDEQNTVFIVKTKILPIGETVNAGRTLSSWMRVNFGALRGLTNTSGKKAPGKQKTMSAISLSKMKQFVNAGGVDLSMGWTPELFDQVFPLDTALNGDSLLDGQKFVVVMKDEAGRPRPDGKGNTQDVESVVPAEGL